jgi:hypothetical protein
MRVRARYRGIREREGGGLTVYGYERDDFLRLEPDEIGAAIWQSVRRQEPEQVIPWKRFERRPKASGC